MENYSVDYLINKMEESMEDLTPQEAEFLGNSFKEELIKLMTKYKAEISLDIIEGKLNPNEIKLTTEILHYTGIELVKGNLEFNNITPNSLR